MRRLITGAVAVVVVWIVVALFALHAGNNSPSASVLPNLKPFGMRFSSRPAAQSHITKHAAVAAAAKWSFGKAGPRRLPAGVSVLARYGLFSDDTYGMQLRSGKFHPTFQSKPAWIVTFYGPGIKILPIGPRRVGGRGRPVASVMSPADHATNVVVDARTGASMIGFS